MRTIAAVYLIVIFLSAATVNAAEESPVYLDPAEAGIDFELQGEYRGWQRSQPSHRSSESVGLQVIARGDGKFEAFKLYGGLPGEGWFGGRRHRLTGARVDDVLPLLGDEYDILIAGESAAIFAKDGRKAGVLRKVARASPTLGAAPPPGAVVLFNGEPSDHLKSPKITPEGQLKPGTETRDTPASFFLHAEFLLPFKPHATGQARGNSGFYLHSRYEVQVLDSFGLEGVENECAALYKQRRPDVNMCLPPLQWQTYDIDFTAPQFADDGRKTANARISVWHNGVLVHTRAEVTGKTGAGQLEGPASLPTKLQDHGNPVLFRNIWLVDQSRTSPGSKPGLPSRQAPMPVDHAVGGSVAGR
jgi:hypothetical protein